MKKWPLLILVVFLCQSALAFPTSTISVSSPDIDPGQAVAVPMGASLTITVDVQPDETVNYGLRLKLQGQSSSFRSLSPTLNDGSQSWGYFMPEVYPAGQHTFQVQALNLPVGTYVLDGFTRSTTSDNFGTILSEPFSITPGISTNVLPTNTSFTSVAELFEQVATDTINQAQPFGLYGMDGVRRDSVRTGDQLLLAIDTRNAASIANQVTFDLSRADGAAPFTLFEVYPLPGLIEPGQALAVDAIPAERLTGEVLIRLFHVPPHLDYIDQSGSLSVKLGIDAATQELVLPLLDGPVKPPIPLNPCAAPLETFRVHVVGMGFNTPTSELEPQLANLENLFSASMKNYVEIETTLTNLSFDDFDIDYLAWWQAQPKVPGAEQLDPNNPLHFDVIQHIYGFENGMMNRAFLEAQHPAGSAGEDVTLYRYMASSGGGVSSNGQIAENRTPLNQFFSPDYKTEQGFQLPSFINENRTLLNNQLDNNVSAHELGHTLWRSRNHFVGHIQGYYLLQGPGTINRLQKYLQSYATVRAVGLESLMSNYRDRTDPNGTGGSLISDVQLDRIIDLYSIDIHRVQLVGNTYEMSFTSNPGVTNWVVKGADLPSDFTIDWTGATTITETSPGRYEARVDLGDNTELPRHHFLIERSVPEERALEFYGMQYVEDSADYETVANLGINALLLDFSSGAGASAWLAQLDEAQAAGFRVVAVHWDSSQDNFGWSWNDATEQWDISASAQSFVETVAGHPALIAVYALHEPYWNNCEQCGYTTAQQQKLYQQIKAIADVQVYSAFSSFFYAENEYGPEYRFADGVCDYCDTWIYPSEFVEEGSDQGFYNRDRLVNRLASELAHVREVAPNSKFIWILQAFESEVALRKLPTYEQMIDLASIVMEYDEHGGVDGVFWYVWDFDPSEYQEVLSDHPELQPAVREIYDRYVAPTSPGNDPPADEDLPIQLRLPSDAKLIEEGVCDCPLCEH